MLNEVMCMEAKHLRQEDDCVWEANAKASVQVKYDATFSCLEKKILPSVVSIIPQGMDI